VLSDGRTRTDPSSFTADEIADAGYVAAPDKPQLVEHQWLSWSGTEWVVHTKTQEEIAYEEQVKAEQAAQQRDEQRRLDYQKEADPLFFKWQRGEGTQEAWLAKVAEIKARG
jgi:hypothetical protein